ncbi:immunoglobulin-like domain-containing protein [Arcobacter peruensis]|uniref:immunoglobulin-like domain-containing protein n=1 Tax=Arcobacter peruensis TaxID=2320140 RepID=UPI000F07C707|nr:immunoglobulin-like domain-containing protein [Arcobacter peruensis]
MTIKKEVMKNTAIIRFIEHNKKKFKLTYDNRNGTPLGFDSRFKLEILKDDLWKVIAGKDDIEFNQISYVSDRTQLIEDSRKFFTLMQKHIILMY